MPDSALRAAVNLLWCVPGEVGGSEEYLVRQLTGLCDVASSIELTLFASHDFVDAHPELCDRVHTITPSDDGRRRVRRIVTENTWLNTRTKRFDLVHHGGGTAPMIGSDPIVLTIHDLQYLTHPEYHSRLKLRYLQATVPRSARRAAIVVTPSAWVKSTVIDRLGIGGDRVVVVPHGVEATLGVDAPGEAELRRTFGLGAGPVLVFPAITHPHKGHEFLLDVMAASWTDPSLRLVLLGGAGRADAAVADAVERLGLRDRVLRPGRVPSADRDGLIAMAHALVFPSEYEGFGAPVVEAMALGTPVIAADQPALVEVIGDAGLVLPRSAAAWATALDVLERNRDELVRAGRRRAEHFSAEHSGLALADAYRAAVSTRGDR